MNNYKVRTDLALEAAESIFKNCSKKISGVNIEEYETTEKVYVTKIEILSKNAERNLGKPRGKYYTIEARELQDYDEGFHEQISKQLANIIKSIIQNLEKNNSILIVGLGNREVTADSLGPCTVDNIHITRHIIKEYGLKAYKYNNVKQISALEPGVMAKTGMETLEIIKGVIKEINPDAIILIDALAAKNIKRLNRTIQITDAGIHPGSGVGNYRQALTNESLGIPTIAIGIPMVVSVETIINNVLINLYDNNTKIDKTLNMSKLLMDLQLENMYVTTKNIDEITKRLSFTISEAINMALEM